MRSAHHAYFSQQLRLLAVLVLLAQSVALAGDHVIHVDQSATGNNDGSSWADAFRDLQDALNDAFPGVEIWVASGVYKPETGTDRLATFLLRDGVAVYGGFSGTETQRSERSWQAHITTLSGDINNSGNDNGNAFHVVTGNGTDSTSILDGFRIEGGTATESDPHSRGGGVYNSNGSPTLTNLVITGNRAHVGGGIFNSNSSPVLINVSLVGNRASSFGGGMANESGSSPVLTNVSFSGNHAGTAGGGMDNYNSSHPIIRNSLFWENWAISFDGTSHSISNSDSTPSISHSLMEDCKPAGIWNSGCGLEIGDTNLPDADPLFIDTPDPADAPSTAGNLRLRAESPALDSGDSAIVDAIVDLAGNARIVNQDVDIGAYERPSDSCPDNGVVYVNQQAHQPGDGLAWSSAFKALQDAMIVVDSCEIWVAAGIYKPTSGTNRAATFALTSEVGIFGGFDGTESLRSQRNWQTNPTVLSGDINQVGNIADNSFHVVSGSGTDDTAVLDGFTVIAGNADGETDSPCDQNCGGGIFNDSGSPRLQNIRLTGNQAAAWGGGIYNSNNSSPLLINIAISGNRAGWGGGMYNLGGSSPVLNHVAFAGNRVEPGEGGGLRNSDGSNPAVRNTIFWNNRDASGTGTASASIANNNSAPLVSYSLVQGCNAGGIWDAGCGSYAIINLPDANPQFVEMPSPDDAPATSGNVRLTASSPAIDVGNDKFFDDLENARDLAASPRKVGDAVDLGPYEYYPLPDALYSDRFELEAP